MRRRLSEAEGDAGVPVIKEIILTAETLRRKEKLKLDTERH